MNAPDKALPHVVTGLISKRAELAGWIEHLQAQVRQATVELDHIEASIRIFPVLRSNVPKTLLLPSGVRG